MILRPEALLESWSAAFGCLGHPTCISASGSCASAPPFRTVRTGCPCCRRGATNAIRRSAGGRSLLLCQHRQAISGRLIPSAIPLGTTQRVLQPYGDHSLRRFDLSIRCTPACPPARRKLLSLGFFEFGSDSLAPPVHPSPARTSLAGKSGTSLGVEPDSAISPLRRAHHPQRSTRTETHLYKQKLHAFIRVVRRVSRSINSLGEARRSRPTPRADRRPVATSADRLQRPG